jgi:hypothetical protein
MALVTICKGDSDNPMFLINVTDESLYHILPFGILALNSNGEFETPHGLKHRSAFELVSCISRALLRHTSTI